VHQTGNPPPPPEFGTYAPVPPSRPATLTFAYFGALLAGLFSAVGATVLIIQARSLAEQTARDVAADLLGVDPSEVPASIVTGTADDVVGTLVTRGVMGLVSALFIIGVALAVRNGALWARIVLTVLLLGGMCANGLVVTDVSSGVTKALGIAAIVLGLAVVVLLFLPPTNRYAKSRKHNTA
jgi:hypothetical protein